MRWPKWVWIVALAVLMLAGRAGMGQIDPASPPADTTSVNDTAPLPTDAVPANATDDPPALDTTTDTGIDTTGNTPVTPLADEDLSRLKMGFELETEAWLLPLAVFISTLLLGLALHGILVTHDVKRWPDTSGSWWKLRFWPLLLAL